MFDLITQEKVIPSEYTFHDYIRSGYQDRINEFRNYVYNKSMKLGEELMPSDIVNVILKSQFGGKFKDLLFNGMTNSWCGSLLLLKDVHESCGFAFYEPLTRETYFNYF